MSENLIIWLELFPLELEDVDVIKPRNESGFLGHLATQFLWTVILSLNKELADLSGGWSKMCKTESD